MFGKAAPKKCLPRTTKRYQKITRTYRKRGANGFVATFCLVTFGKSPRYLLQCDCQCSLILWNIYALPHNSPVCAAALALSSCEIPVAA